MVHLIPELLSHFRFVFHLRFPVASVQAFGIEGMSTKDLTRFGKGGCQKQRLVGIL